LDAGVATLSIAADDMANALQNFENQLPPNVRTQLSGQIDAVSAQMEALLTNASELNKLSIDSAQLEKEDQEISQKLMLMTEGLADVNQSIDAQISDLIRSNEEISDSTKAALIKNLNAIVDANLTNLEKSMTA
jgi:nitrogenase molybdenum-iron protein alpha/beta subunit